MAEKASDILLNIKVDYQDALKGIIEYRQKIEDVEKTQKKWKEELDRGKITQDEYKSKIAQTTVVNGSYEERLKLLTKELQNSNTAFESSKGSITSMNAAMSNLKNQFSKMSEMERCSQAGLELQINMQMLEIETNKATERFAALNAVTGELGNIFTGGFSMSNLISSFQDLTLKGGSIGDIFTMMKTKFIAFGTAVKANPIMAIISLILPLVEMLVEKIKENEKAMQLLNLAMKPLEILSRALDEAITAISESIMSFADKGLAQVSQAIVDVVNRFIDLYNRSEDTRRVVQSIVIVFEAVFLAAKYYIKQCIDNLEPLGKAIEALLTGNIGLLKEAFNDVTSSYAQSGISFLSEMEKKIKESTEKIKNGKLGYIEIPNKQKKLSKKLDSGKSKNTIQKEQEEQDRIKQIEEATSEIFKTELEKRQSEIEKAYEEKTKYLESLIIKEENLNAQQLESNELLNKAIVELEKKKTEDLSKLTNENLEKEAQKIKEQAEFKLSLLKENSQEYLDERIKILEQEKALELQKAEKLNIDKELVEKKYNDLIIQEKLNHEKNLNQQVLESLQSGFNDRINAALKNNESLLQIEQEAIQERLALKQQELDSMKQLEGESDDEFNARKSQKEAEIAVEQEALLKKETEIAENEAAKKKAAYQGLYDSLYDFMEEFAGNNEAFAAFSKALALYQIGVDTATALTAGIAASQKAGPFPANMVAIATTVSTVLANIVKAKKMLSSEKPPKAKFATGGYVSGAGSATSDSIPAMLSNGESVLTARATSMFSPMLSAFNQLGGGVPILTSHVSSQVMGEEMLARAFSRAVQQMPNPVVSVEEISTTTNRVKVLEEYRSL